MEADADSELDRETERSVAPGIGLDHFELPLLQLLAVD